LLASPEDPDFLFSGLARTFTIETNLKKPEEKAVHTVPWKRVSVAVPYISRTKLPEYLPHIDRNQ
jgi:hypothetical protein